MSFEAKVVGREEVVAHFQRAGGLVQQFISQAVAKSGYAVESRTREKLTGDVLKVRTGRLRRSIHTQLTNAPNESTAQVGTNVEYAAIHEYGGTIKAHEIIPRNALALRFQPKGSSDFIFRKKASIPDVTMPERSYLRSSLTDLAPTITDWLREAVSKGISA